MTAKKQSKTISAVCTAMMIWFFLICVGALFYPYVNNHIVNRKMESVAASFDHRVRQMDADEKARLLADAQAYNENLRLHPTGYALSVAQMAEYNAALRITDDGIMGKLRIPAIDVNLLIYHTADDAVLSAAVGHLPGSSLPVGGKGSHCVLTGHTGLTTATLFTNVNRLEIGDVFYIDVLDDVLTYEVDQIEVVLPRELDKIVFDDNEDYCTLVTCTPYGVNSHRLLVRGTRVSTPTDAAAANAAGSVESILVPVKRRGGPDFSEWLALAGLLLIVVVIAALTVRRVRAHRTQVRRLQELLDMER